MTEWEHLYQQWESRLRALYTSGGTRNGAMTFSHFFFVSCHAPGLRLASVCVVPASNMRGVVSPSSQQVRVDALRLRVPGACAVDAAAHARRRRANVAAAHAHVHPHRAVSRRPPPPRSLVLLGYLSSVRLSPGTVRLCLASLHFNPPATCYRPLTAVDFRSRSSTISFQRDPLF